MYFFSGAILLTFFYASSLSNAWHPPKSVKFTASSSSQSIRRLPQLCFSSDITRRGSWKPKSTFCQFQKSTPRVKVLLQSSLQTIYAFEEFRYNSRKFSRNFNDETDTINNLTDCIVTKHEINRGEEEAADTSSDNDDDVYLTGNLKRDE